MKKAYNFHEKQFIEREVDQANNAGRFEPKYNFHFIAMQLSGARRLRDAIILGYQLQRAPGRDICIPDWYTSAESELGLGSGSPTFQMSERSSLLES